MPKTIYIVDIESVETRYTAQWKSLLPIQLKKHFQTVDFNIQVISGEKLSSNTTPGAFLNFSGTNIYKSQQLISIAKLFSDNTVKAGDYFLYTDAWNPTVIQLRYMSELLGIPIKIGGLWHAGSYDPQDFLGRLIGDAPWVRNAESSMFYCYDDNFFATKFHLDIFCKNLFDESPSDEFIEWHKDKIHVVGWPMEYINEALDPYLKYEKKNKIIFPHRLAPEKQLEIFKDLARSMPEYEWVVAQEKKLTKRDYYFHLAESKIVFSANLQETLGISMYEGAVVGSFPLVPDRLSYSEMWDNFFKYPSEWTENWESYQYNKPLLVNKIRQIMGSNNRDLPNTVRNKILDTGRKYFTGRDLYNTINKSLK